MTIIIVRRHIHLIKIRHRGNVARAHKAVPYYINRCDIHRVRFEIRTVLADAVQVLARTNGNRKRLLHIPKRPRIIRINLKPRKAILLKHPPRPKISFCFKIKIEIKNNTDIVPNRIAQCSYPPLDCAKGLCIHIQLRPADAFSKSRHVDIRRIPKNRNVRFDGFEAGSAYFFSKRPEVIV